MGRGKIAKYACSILSAILVAGALAAPESAIAAPTVIANVRIFDGDSVVETGTVVIGDGIVQAVGQEVSTPESAAVIDGQGRTLLPGLIDAHVHIWHRQALEQAAVFGVTSVLDMFMDPELMAAIKQEQAANPWHGAASLYSAGILATAPGGHGSEYGLQIPTINAPAQAPAFVAARKAEGADYIKIVYDNGATYGRAFPTLDSLTCAALVEAAQAQGLLAIVHAGSQEEARQALAMGADGLAHVFADRTDAEFAAWVAGQSAFVVPTLTVIEGVSGAGERAALLGDVHLAPYLSSADQANMARRLPIARPQAYAVAERAVGQLQAASVPLLAGSDAPNPGTAYGASLHRELELLVRAGLTPVQALATATSVPARYFGLAGRGRIAAGSAADLLLVEGDPTTDILATRAIVAVWKNGQRVDRKAYRAGVEAEAASREEAASPAATTDGLLSDFETRPLPVAFGAGWSVSTDSLMGGTSTAQYEWVAGGAEASKGAMAIGGVVAEGSSNPWAGAMVWPGTHPMSPADLSAHDSINFWARGDGKTYYLMFFTQSLGYMPSIQTFVAGDDWAEFTFAFEQFGIDGRDITGIFWGGGPQAGAFALQLDQIRFK